MVLTQKMKESEDLVAVGTRRATLNNKDGSKKYVIIEVRK